MRLFICEDLIYNLDSNICKIKNMQPKIDKDNFEAYFILNCNNKLN
jgi:hypothetical protein